MKVKFRHEARLALERAKAELQSSDDKRLRYAALELRMAIEALTYDRAQAYKDEIPPKAYETWKPKEVLQLLLDIDPLADEGSTLSIGIQKEDGGVGPMYHMGRETVFNLSAVKKHYNALGSYLHTPSLKQVEAKGILSYEKGLRARCEKIAEMIENVLASPHWNNTFGKLSTCTCSRCAQPIRRRMPRGDEGTDAECFNCGARYMLAPKGADVEWTPVGYRMTCPNESCEKKFFFWSDEAKLGRVFQCDSCKKEWMFALGFVDCNPGTRL